MENRVRATPEQLSMLLEFMETHGELTRPVTGPQGRIRSDQLWCELTNLLHSVGGGVKKTTEKWKKVWADWKSKTKKKALVMRRHSRKIEGGQQTLSATDRRVLAVMVISARGVSGEQSSVEFNKSSSPARDDLNTDALCLEIKDEYSQLSSSQVSNSSHQPTLSPQAPPSPQAPGPSSLPVSFSLPASSPSPVPSSLPISLSLPAPSSLPVSLSLSVPSSLPVSLSLPAPAPSVTPPSTMRRLRLRPAGSLGRLSYRRRQAPTSFETAARNFTTVELRRLELEETRIKLQHERELRALEIEHERNQVFQSLVNVAKAWIDSYPSRDNTADEH